tara:strand:+ start:169 stop:825 length:657 start_codon:yes stop_codon:yes gene_type:complete
MNVSDFCKPCYPPITPDIIERISKLDKKIFFILSTARCRSSWFANLFTYRDSFCYNEESRYLRNWNDLVDRIEERPEEYVGFEDPEFLHYINSLYRLFPNATYVLLERDREQSEFSLCNESNAPIGLVRKKFDRWYSDIENFKNLIPHYETIHFSEMDDKDIVEKIWNYILPDAKFDIGRWNLLTALKISVTMGNKPYPILYDSMAVYFELERLDAIE